MYLLSRVAPSGVETCRIPPVLTPDPVPAGRPDTPLRSVAPSHPLPLETAPVTSTPGSATPGSAPSRAELSVRTGRTDAAIPVLPGLHVLIVSSHYRPQSGGVAPFITGLAEHLTDRAERVSVLTQAPRGPRGWLPAPDRSRFRFAGAGRYSPDGPRVIRLHAGDAEAVGPAGRALHELAFLLKAARAGRRLAVDLVIGVTPHPSAAAAAAFLAARSGVPLITLLQSTATGSAASSSTGGRRNGRRPDRPVTRLARAMERYALRHSAEVAVVSQAVGIAAAAAGTEPDRLHLLPCWTVGAPGSRSRQEAREALGW